MEGPGRAGERRRWWWPLRWRGFLSSASESSELSEEASEDEECDEAEETDERRRLRPLDGSASLRRRLDFLEEEAEERLEEEEVGGDLVDFLRRLEGTASGREGGWAESSALSWCPWC